MLLALIILPSKSSVVLYSPYFIVKLCTFELQDKYGIVFVALPRVIGNTHEAKGLSVPK